MASGKRPYDLCVSEEEAAKLEAFAAFGGMSEEEGEAEGETEEETMTWRGRSGIDEKKRQDLSARVKAVIHGYSMENKTTEQNKKSQEISKTSSIQSIFTPATSDSAGPPVVAGIRRNVSLVEEARELKKARGGTSETEFRLQAQQAFEDQLLREANQVSSNALQSNEDIATGSRYSESMKTTWTPPRHLREASQETHEEVRKKWHILVEGEDCPPPIPSFKDMKLPSCILEAMAARGIDRPTPIQVQGLPALLSGRDLIGIAFTGSGKTMTFSIPMLLFALEQELHLKIVAGEGPIGLVLCPSRELARQTFEVVEYYADAIRKNYVDQSGRRGGPSLRSTLVIGGEATRTQLETYNREGVHCMIATPGRLNDHLKAKRLRLDICRYLVLDEGDRMLDLGFDEEVHMTINHIRNQRQTVIFSATMPHKFQDFAQRTLVRPLVVNVGRSGAASLDIIQEVEYVKREAKVVYLLECLQKTAPPVVIFSERKSDVDEIHEYLLIKGVEAVAIHGGKGQDERNEAIKQFKSGQKDVLVATDIAAKGLDFPSIQHVINFDMPSEIENYVHRIGRTGRGGKTGVATTFINNDCPESSLLDLKHLLVEAKQRVPPVLQALEDPSDQLAEIGGVKGCAFCGGLGHRITTCPKLDRSATRVRSGKKDSLVGGGDW